jgi:hypothetical protein
MTQPESPRPFRACELRLAHEGQVLRVAGECFTVLAKGRRRRVVRLDLEAEDGAHATLIGVPQARVRLREGEAAPFPRAPAAPAPADGSGTRYATREQSAQSTLRTALSE